VTVCRPRQGFGSRNCSNVAEVKNPWRSHQVYMDVKYDTNSNVEAFAYFEDPLKRYSGLVGQYNSKDRMGATASLSVDV
jgi:hypothetical protein